MLIFFSILFYPVFLIILYAIGEYVFPTRNGAMIFAFCGAFILSYLYYTIRSKVSQLSKKRTNYKNKKNATITGLMLINEQQFTKYFNDGIADNSFNGLTEEKTLEYLRNNGIPKELNIYSIKGLTPGCRDLLNLLNIKINEHSIEEIIEKTMWENIPEVNIKSRISKKEKLLRGLFSREFEKFAIKYGVILLLISFITPYKLYYILFGSLLILYNITLKILRKTNLQNQIPYLRS